jgi:hypothetical protein
MSRMIAAGSSGRAGAVAHMPVIPVDARRERQHITQWGYHWSCPISRGHSDVPQVSSQFRFHGAPPLRGATGAENGIVAGLPGAGIGGGGGVAMPESRRLYPLTTLVISSVSSRFLQATFTSSGRSCSSPPKPSDARRSDASKSVRPNRLDY